jgi:hypothetical protein
MAAKRAVFSGEAAPREFYNALEGVIPPPGVPVQLNTFFDVLYTGHMKNIFFIEPSGHSH